ncbi:CDP-diacylglycerol-serine O-phosphatidyltransferase [Anaerohalosphaera lusitana]|uniref:CDP-diacylglycerol-serine O-phosphatidyltransferase n=1 Tax=Anaerohalosphaera lusitana TaxID=1936003 RepID=A0A1U9NG13_9BACT|nr:CDP-alcohol phosphatidyltransferase family protein [Anaerohalosphaera lusitana]AQT66872.1 CDP-diacylglycerol-serine O-phosphatidyltransferase [Anaerohalosphaera lusitana]
MTPKQNNNGTKANLMRRVHKHRLKTVAVLPSLITLLNGLAGFAAIWFAGDGMYMFSFHQVEISYFSVAAALIFIAMVADMLDGRIARMSHATSSFGGQLDSLCDVISFGLAPAYLVLKMMEYKLTALVNPPAELSGFLTRFIWLAAAVYLACAAIRLARFNVENEEDETSHMSFMGLPTPAAAGGLASMVMFYEGLVTTVSRDSIVFTLGEGFILFSMPFAAMMCGLLMISRIRYPHVVNQLIRGRQPMTHLLYSLVLLGLILWSLTNALLIVFWLFIFSGLFKWAHHLALRTRHKHTNTEPANTHAK